MPGDKLAARIRRLEALRQTSPHFMPRRAELDEQEKTRALTIDEQWERAGLISETESSVAALPALKG